VSAEARAPRRGRRNGFGADVSTTLRRPAALALLVLTGAIGAGCGSTAPSETGAAGAAGASSGAASSAQRPASARQKGVRFAQCMRDHGVGAFPDPDASGDLTIDAIANGTSLDTGSAAFEQAVAACRDLQPPGFTGQTRSPEKQSTALKFAQCVRDHGVADFPDPTPDSPLVDTTRIPSTARDGGMSALNAAMRTCGVAFGDELGVKRP
jgi:hypothetical protein